MGWTHGDVCERVNIGLPEGKGLKQQTLSVLEIRDSRSSEFACRIADALGVSVRWLMDGVGNPTETDWPFNRVNRGRWDACNLEDRAYVQAAINRALDDCEAGRAPPPTPTKPSATKRVTMAESIARGKSKITLTMGDGNPDQSSLPLATVEDPFTAEPSPRESRFYRRIKGYRNTPQ